ncbi:MAG: hypothetical protein ACI8PZ_007160 [Myxococcota bacterium]|jgi:hypothetical protein
MLMLLATLATPSSAAPVLYDAAYVAVEHVAPGAIDFFQTKDVAVGPDGTVYFTLPTSVWSYDPGTGATLELASGLDSLQELFVADDGTVWVVEYSEGVSQLDAFGAVLEHWDVVNGLIGLEQTPDGRVFTNSHLDGTIYELLPGGVVEDFALAPFNPVYDRPGCCRLYGLSVAPDGALWATDLGCDEWVLRVVDGADALPLDERLEIMFEDAPAFGYYFTAFKPDGTMFLRYWPGGSIDIRTPAGDNSLWATDVGEGYSGMDYDAATDQLWVSSEIGLWSFDGPGGGGPCVGPDTDGDGVCDAEDACEGHDDAIDWNGDGSPDGCGVEPSVLGLQADGLASDGVATIDVAGGVAGETAYLLGSKDGTGVGTCPAFLGYNCLDLNWRTRLLQTAVVGPDGQAHFEIAIPLLAPGTELAVQAAIQRGPGGADSVVSNVVLSVP